MLKHIQLTAGVGSPVGYSGSPTIQLAEPELPPGLGSAMALFSVGPGKGGRREILCPESRN
jgi:hypothetical protein